VFLTAVTAVVIDAVLRAEIMEIDKRRPSTARVAARNVPTLKIGAPTRAGRRLMGASPGVNTGDAWRREAFDDRNAVHEVGKMEFAAEAGGILAGGQGYGLKSWIGVERRGSFGRGRLLVKVSPRFAYRLLGRVADDGNRTQGVGVRPNRRLRRRVLGFLKVSLGR
jgi:hypothetical protein